jgi:hypothetical protein
MQSVEETLGVTGDVKEIRNSLMAKIGAWSLDNPDQKPLYEEIFAEQFSKLRDAYYEEHEVAVSQAVRHFLVYVSEGHKSLSEEDRKQAKLVENNLYEKYGYQEDAARDIIRVLARERYSG